MSFFSAQTGLSAGISIAGDDVISVFQTAEFCQPASDFVALVEASFSEFYLVQRHRDQDVRFLPFPVIFQVKAGISSQHGSDFEEVVVFESVDESLGAVIKEENGPGSSENELCFCAMRAAGIEERVTAFGANII